MNIAWARYKHIVKGELEKCSFFLWYCLLLDSIFYYNCIYLSYIVALFSGKECTVDHHYYTIIYSFNNETQFLYGILNSILSVHLPFSTGLLVFDINMFANLFLYMTYFTISLLLCLYRKCSFTTSDNSWSYTHWSSSCTICLLWHHFSSTYGINTPTDHHHTFYSLCHHFSSIYGINTPTDHHHVQSVYCETISPAHMGSIHTLTIIMYNLSILKPFLRHIWDQYRHWLLPYIIVYCE